MPLDHRKGAQFLRSSYVTQIDYPPTTGEKLGRYYNVGQVARQLQVSVERVRIWLASGKLEGVRLSPGGPWRIEATAVKAFLKSQGAGYK